MQTLIVGLSTYVVVLSGELDDDAAAQLADELARLERQRIVVDMIDVRLAAASALDALTRAAERSTLTVVAEAGASGALERAAVEGALDLRRSLYDVIADAVAAA